MERREEDTRIIDIGKIEIEALREIGTHMTTENEMTTERKALLKSEMIIESETEEILAPILQNTQNTVGHQVVFQSQREISTLTADRKTDMTKRPRNVRKRHRNTIQVSIARKTEKITEETETGTKNKKETNTREIKTETN